MLRYLSLLCGMALLLAAAVALGIRSEQNEGLMARAYSWAHQTLWLAWRDLLAAAGHPPGFLDEALYAGSGVTRGGDIDDGALILLSGWFPDGDRLRLIRRDGTPVARWDFRGVQLRGTHGIHMDAQGSPIFNAEQKSLVRLDRCGNILLELPGRFHHSVTPSEKGGWWALDLDDIYRWEAPADHLPPHTSEFFRSKGEEDIELFATPLLWDDTIVRVDASGAVVQKLSIARLIYEGGLEHIFHKHTLVGDRELTHSNSVQELSAELAPAFPMFEAGDLLLSLRAPHLVLVVNPDTREIKWHQSGPWAWQHDALFQPDGTITLFNNNHRMERPAVRDFSLLTSWHRYNPDLHSNILRVHPADGRVEVVAGREISAESHFYTRNRGQHQMLPGGGVLVVEAEAGRVVQLNPQGQIIWEYINRYDEEYAAEIVNAYVYPAGYFQVDDWSCPAR